MEGVSVKKIYNNQHTVILIEMKFQKIVTIIHDHYYLLKEFVDLSI